MMDTILAKLTGEQFKTFSKVIVMLLWKKVQNVTMIMTKISINVTVQPNTIQQQDIVQNI
ncbi:hypothetical protein [Bacillus xiapuensis]|uniref:hypothetical protein n=1 Tax=Bacillus xiapuensis TaxID=2014075 RepID=UPI0012FDE16A|nr:hypothetical protein [Bacillus xiapuensis]